MTYDQQELGLWRDPESGGDKAPRMPGEYILKELKNRGWGQADLANIIGRQPSAINDLIQGKRSISPEIAVALSKAFGSPKDLWIHREAAYRLSLVENEGVETERRAALYNYAPIKELQRRGWISADAETSDDLERELAEFMGVSALGDAPRVSAAARKACPLGEFTSAQRAWLLQASRMASVLTVRPFSQESLAAAFTKLRKMMLKPELSANLGSVMADAGIRLVIVEDLNHTKIDGAAFNLNEDPSKPTVVLSLRLDRMDSFWHTLLHELIHIKHGDPVSIDVDGLSPDRSSMIYSLECRANKEGAGEAIPNDSMESFILRAKPSFALERIRQFAARMGVHPCIVVGQLQHLELIGWDRFADIRPKVREHVIAGALTDGYGKRFTKHNLTKTEK